MPLKIIHEHFEDFINGLLNLHGTQQTNMICWQKKLRAELQELMLSPALQCCGSLSDMQTYHKDNPISLKPLFETTVEKAASASDPAGLVPWPILQTCEWLTKHALTRAGI